MLPDMLPMGPGAAAARLDVEPFELVRLLIASGDDGPIDAITSARLEAVRAFAAVETWWGADRSPPRDDKAARGAIRGALQELLDRGYVGDRRTRVDNLWRGLPPGLHGVVEEAVEVLVEHGLLSVRAEPMGQLVAARPEGRDRLVAIVAGKDVPDDLARLWT